MPITIQTLLTPGIMSSLLNVRSGANDNTMMIKNKNEAILRLRNALENPNSVENKKLLEVIGLKQDPDPDHEGVMILTNSDQKEFKVRLSIVSTNHAVNALRCE